MLRLNREETIHDLLVRNIPRDLVMALEEATLAGAQRAHVAAQGMDNGHLPSVVGQLRHFHINETFHRALSVAGASPSPLRGNQIVTGQTGIFTLARINTRIGGRGSGWRSKTRKQLSLANAAIEYLVQPELFSDYVEPSQAVVFIIACFGEPLHINPVAIDIAVPDRYMQSWLFWEPIDTFIKRYDQQPTTTQDDLAVPKLKKNFWKQEGKGTRS